uniref:HAD-IIA family hydrolase n=1 Tax=candidate division WOR-3 bacterium TaxID=2052148 RepID=A0A7C4Y405_UNCW3
MGKIKGLFLDLVGTIVQGKNLIPYDGAVESFNRLRDDFKICIITNNTTEKVEGLKEKLEEKGFILKDVILLTPLLILKNILKEKEGKVFFIGSEAVKETIIESGKEISEEGEIVVIGLDFELNYRKLTIATKLLLNGAEFIGLHNNRLFQRENGVVEPSVGPILSFLQFATGRKPFIIGKPEWNFYAAGLNMLQLNPDETIVVGDDPISEVRAPKRLGIKTIFLRCGKYKELPKSIISDFVFDSFKDIDWDKIKNI